MSSIQTRSLSYRIAHKILFEKMNITIDQGLFGIMGPNGSGKSSLLSLLAGHAIAEQGQVFSQGRVLWLPQFNAVHDWPAALGPDLWTRVFPWWQLERGHTTTDIITSLEDAWDWIAAWDKISDRWAVRAKPWALEPSTLSGGELQRLRLALLELLPNEIMLLDEPTLHLDSGARELFHEMLQKTNALSVIASHDRDLMELAHRILYLESGRHHIYEGNYSLMRGEQDAVEARLEREIQLIEDEKAKEKREAQKVNERQARRSAQGKRKASDAGLPQILLGARQRNAEKTTGKLNAVQERKRDEITAKERDLKTRKILRTELNFDLKAAETKAGRWLLEIRALNIEVGGEKLWSKDLDFTLERGQVLWLKGGNGSGKSTLLKALTQPSEHPLSILVFAKKLLYLDQKLIHLEPDSNLLGTWNDPDFIPDESQRRTIAARLGLGPDLLQRRFASLSGGERMRVALTLLSTQKIPPELILLDEPGNHLDLPTQEALVHTLKQFKAGLVLVSHEKALLDDLHCDVVLDLDAYRFRVSSENVT